MYGTRPQEVCLQLRISDNSLREGSVADIGENHDTGFVGQRGVRRIMRHLKLRNLWRTQNRTLLIGGGNRKWQSNCPSPSKTKCPGLLLMLACVLWWAEKAGPRPWKWTGPLAACPSWSIREETSPGGASSQTSSPDLWRQQLPKCSEWQEDKPPVRWYCSWKQAWRFAWKGKSEWLTRLYPVC